MSTNLQETPSRVSGKANTNLPSGMTQEEAHRLVREADQRTKENA